MSESSLIQAAPPREFLVQATTRSALSYAATVAGSFGLNTSWDFLTPYVTKYNTISNQWEILSRRTINQALLLLKDALPTSVPIVENISDQVVFVSEETEVLQPALSSLQEYADNMIETSVIIDGAPSIYEEVSPSIKPSKVRKTAEERIGAYCSYTPNMAKAHRAISDLVVIANLPSYEVITTELESIASSLTHLQVSPSDPVGSAISDVGYLKNLRKPYDSVKRLYHFEDMANRINEKIKKLEPKNQHTYTELLEHPFWQPLHFNLKTNMLILRSKLPVSFQTDSRVATVSLGQRISLGHVFLFLQFGSDRGRIYLCFEDVFYGNTSTTYINDRAFTRYGYEFLASNMDYTELLGAIFSRSTSQKLCSEDLAAILAKFTYETSTGTDVRMHPHSTGADTFCFGTWKPDLSSYKHLIETLDYIQSALFYHYHEGQATSMHIGFGLEAIISRQLAFMNKMDRKFHLPYVKELQKHPSLGVLLMAYLNKTSKDHRCSYITCNFLVDDNLQRIPDEYKLDVAGPDMNMRNYIHTIYSITKDLPYYHMAYKLLEGHLPPYIIKFLEYLKQADIAPQAIPLSWIANLNDNTSSAEMIDIVATIKTTFQTKTSPFEIAANILHADLLAHSDSLQKMPYTYKNVQNECYDLANIHVGMRILNKSRETMDKLMQLSITQDAVTNMLSRLKTVSYINNINIANDSIVYGYGRHITIPEKIFMRSSYHKYLEVKFNKCNMTKNLAWKNIKIIFTIGYSHKGKNISVLVQATPALGTAKQYPFILQEPKIMHPYLLPLHNSYSSSTALFVLHLGKLESSFLRSLANLDIVTAIDIIHKRLTTFTPDDALFPLELYDLSSAKMQSAAQAIEINEEEEEEEIENNEDDEEPTLVTDYSEDEEDDS